MNKTVASPVNEPDTATDLPALIAKQDWYVDKHKAVAMTFYNMNKDVYPAQFIEVGIFLWKTYYDCAVPKVHKEAVSAAALEYLLTDLLGLDVTQTELPVKYNVSVGSISNRFRDV